MKADVPARRSTAALSAAPVQRRWRGPGTLGLAGCAICGLAMHWAAWEPEPATARRRVDPMKGFYPSAMPRYPGAHERPAGPTTKMGGSEGRMSFFATDDDPLAVARHYSRFWRAQKLWVRRNVTRGGGTVSAIDEKNGQIYQALILVKGNQTLVFPSMTSAPLATTAVSGPPPIPLFPRSRVLYQLSTGGKDYRATISLSVNRGAVSDNLRHLRRELRAAGFAAEPGTERSKVRGSQHRTQLRLLLYRNAKGDEITATVTRLGDGQSRVHLVKVTS